MSRQSAYHDHEQSSDYKRHSELANGLRRAIKSLDAKSFPLEYLNTEKIHSDLTEMAMIGFRLEKERQELRAERDEATQEVSG